MRLVKKEPPFCGQLVEYYYCVCEAGSTSLGVRRTRNSAYWHVPHLAALPVSGPMASCNEMSLIPAGLAHAHTSAVIAELEPCSGLCYCSSQSVSDLGSFIFTSHGCISMAGSLPKPYSKLASLESVSTCIFTRAPGALPATMQLAVLSGMGGTESISSQRF